MSVSIKRDYSGKLLAFHRVKASKWICGKDYRTVALVLIVCGVRFDVRF